MNRSFLYTLVFCFLFLGRDVFGWGFFMHREIAIWALYSIPQELRDWYDVEQFSEGALSPDKRRSSTPWEHVKHYVDLEHVKDTSLFSDSYLQCKSSPECLEAGVVHFTIRRHFHRLKNAFRLQDTTMVRWHSAELAHYAADACVPLHTTKNYDGQLTGQEGIHALWESYIPENHSFEWMLFGIRGETIQNLEKRIEHEIYSAHALVDSVLAQHKLLQRTMGDKTYGIFFRKNKGIEGYSPIFQSEYYQLQTEILQKQTKKSIQFVADLIVSAHVYSKYPKNNKDSTLDSTYILDSIPIDSTPNKRHTHPE